MRPPFFHAYARCEFFRQAVRAAIRHVENGPPAPAGLSMCAAHRFQGVPGLGQVKRNGFQDRGARWSVATTKLNCIAVVRMRKPHARGLSRVRQSPRKGKAGVPGGQPRHDWPDALNYPHLRRLIDVQARSSVQKNAFAMHFFYDSAEPPCGSSAQASAPSFHSARELIRGPPWSASGPPMSSTVIGARRPSRSAMSWPTSACHVAALAHV